MFYNQPLSVRFGTELLRHIDHQKGIEPYWDSLDVAVAWVRASGMAHLSKRLEHFLGHGGQLCFTVGIDLRNTTKEGLQALLALEKHGNCKTYVYHNEAGSIFHPKLYLFRNEEEARLIVGSNNLTESGLYSNVEAGLQVDTEIDSGVIQHALDALSSWQDTSSKMALRLDDEILDALVKGGYVVDEAAAKAQIQKEKVGRFSRKEKPLFGARKYSAPAVEKPGGKAKSATGSAGSSTTAVPTALAAPPAVGSVLLMRLRRASETERRTQTQIPIRVVNSFFKSSTNVTSAHSGLSHGIRTASARGTINTMKLEIPEMRDFVDPVARFERQPTGIVYEAHDASSPEGRQIMASLNDGLRDGETQLTVKDKIRATWWRFI